MLHKFFDDLGKKMDDVFNHVEKLDTLFTDEVAKAAPFNAGHLTDLLNTLLINASPQDTKRVIWLVQNAHRFKPSGNSYSFEFRGRWFRPKSMQPMRQVLDMAMLYEIKHRGQR